MIWAFRKKILISTILEDNPSTNSISKNGLQYLQAVFLQHIGALGIIGTHKNTVYLSPNITAMRTETDIIGSMDIPANALFGIHALRAKENFPDDNPFKKEWYQAIGLTKLGVYQTYQKFKKAVHQKYPHQSLPFDLIPDNILEAMITSATEVAEGKHYEHFIVPAISGGAGTSINMNVNEIIANLSLLKTGHQAGEYQYLDPIEHANIYQSTNDVIPTSLRVAITRLLSALEDSINELRTKTEDLETRHRHDIRIGYTQMQEAVPSSWGKLFANYSEALSRDWWRISRCFERIKVVNLGGGAIGTGLTVPQYFIMEVVNSLRKLTAFPFSRSENMSDTTSNLDVFVEVHAILKSQAVNLEKMSADLRLLASDFNQSKDIMLPPVQAGSSAMPGKVNPVICEFVISAAQKVYANDMLISNLAGKGALDLNAYLPALGNAMIESLKLLIAATQSMTKNVLTGLTINTESSKAKLYHSPSISTALIPYLGYHQSGALAQHMKAQQLDIFTANAQLNLIDSQQLEEILKPENLLKTGFKIQDIIKE